MSSKRGKQSAEDGVETTDAVDDATTEAGTAGTTDKSAKAEKSAKTKTSSDKAQKADKGATAVGESTTSRRGDRPKKQKPPKLEGVNPTWWVPVMLGLMVVGLIWIVCFYLVPGPDNKGFPIPGIGYGNLAIGFGLVMAGFLMTTRWK